MAAAKKAAPPPPDLDEEEEDEEEESEDENVDDAFETPDEGEREVVTPVVAPKKKEQTYEEKFASVIAALNSNGASDGFGFCSIDISIDGMPVTCIRGSECRFLHADGESDPLYSYAGLSQRLIKFWDGTTQIFKWSIRDTNGRSRGTGLLRMAANVRRQAEFRAETANLGKKEEAHQAFDPDRERARIAAEERAKIERERDDDRDRPRRSRRRDDEEDMPGDPYVYKLERRIDEQGRMIADQRAETMRAFDGFSKTLDAMLTKIMTPAATAPVPQVVAAPAPVNPFSALPPAPSGYEYTLLEGMPVLREKVKPVPATVAAADEDEYDGVYKKMGKAQRFLKKSEEFFGQGKAEGESSKTTSEASPDKQRIREIPDGEGGVAVRLPLDEDGEVIADPMKMAAVNPDILIREAKSLISTVRDAWRESRMPPGQAASSAASTAKPKGDASVLDE